VLVVGDRLGTDIAMGNANQVASALVLTGITTREMLENQPAGAAYRPSHVLDSMAELPALIDPTLST
jgi:ribonucleotide monophosphatase NagD (HAD superfamily)